MSPLPVFKCILIVFVCLSLYPSFFLNKSSFFSINLCYPQFYLTYVRGISSVLWENVSTSFFNYILIIFVWAPLYLWKLPQKSSIFKFFLWISLFLWNMLYRIFSFVRKCLHFIFNYVITLFVCLLFFWKFSNKISILSLILCNLQFYHACIR